MNYGVKCRGCGAIHLRQGREAALGAELICAECGDIAELLVGGSCDQGEVGLFLQLRDVVGEAELNTVDRFLLTALIDQALSEPERERALELIAARLPALSSAAQVVNAYPRMRQRLLAMLAALVRL